MTTREQRRAQQLTRVLEGTITLKEAAIVMGLSVRQARRLKGGLRREGPQALVHQNRGRPSERRTDPATTERVCELYRTKYAEFNVQHFSEFLAEAEGISLGVETVRRILKAAGLIAPKTRRPVHRQRRERMPAEGMLLQIDGTPYRWLGAEGPRWTLLAAVDDATGDPVAAVFREQEDSAGYFELMLQAVTTRGIPAAVYRDRHLIFEASKRVRSTLEEDFAQQRFPTHVGRLFAELGIESIPAHSPQAKGRVERQWRTQQDRLAKELRFAGVQTLAQANAYLPAYLVRYRARFAVAPASNESAYVPIDPATDLDWLFCFKYQRKVQADNTISYLGRVIQIPPGPDRLSYVRAVVEVHERLDGSIAICYQKRVLLVLPNLEEQPKPLRTHRRARPYTTPGALPIPLASPASEPPEAPPPDPLPRPSPALRPWSEVLKQTRPDPLAAGILRPPESPGAPPLPGANHPWRKAFARAANAAERRRENRQADKFIEGQSGQNH